MRSWRKHGVFSKIDFEQAFVHVSWGFLDKIFDRKGFDLGGEDRFQGVYLFSSTFAVIVNGEP